MNPAIRGWAADVTALPRVVRASDACRIDRGVIG